MASIGSTSHDIGLDVAVYEKSLKKHLAAMTTSTPQNFLGDYHDYILPSPLLSIPQSTSEESYYVVKPLADLQKIAIFSTEDRQGIMHTVYLAFYFKGAGHFPLYQAPVESNEAKMVLGQIIDHEWITEDSFRVLSESGELLFDATSDSHSQDTKPK